MHPDERLLDQALTVLAQRSGAVFTRTEALAAGASPAQVATALRSGRWSRLARGTYAIAAGPDDLWHSRVAAAQRRRSGVSVAVGRTAARLHGLPLVGQVPEQVQLLRPREAAARWSGDLPSARIPAAHVTALRGVLVTTLARTAVDVARRGTLLQGVAAIDAVLLRGVPYEGLEEVLRSCPRSAGNRAAALALSRARRGAESPLETLGRLRVVDAGWPEPELQVVVRDAQGFIGRVDQLWRTQGVVGEADGLSKYETPEVLRAEKLREDRLRDAGLEVVRYTWELAWARPEELAERVRRAFARAATRGLAHLWCLRSTPRPPRRRSPPQVAPISGAGTAVPRCLTRGRGRRSLTACAACS